MRVVCLDYEELLSMLESIDNCLDLAICLVDKSNNELLYSRISNAGSIVDLLHSNILDADKIVIDKSKKLC